MSEESELLPNRKMQELISEITNKLIEAYNEILNTVLSRENASQSVWAMTNCNAAANLLGVSIASTIFKSGGSKDGVDVLIKHMFEQVAGSAEACWEEAAKEREPGDKEVVVVSNSKLN